MLRACLVAAVLLLTSISVLEAQTTTGLTQEQFGALVDAVSDSVVKKLEARGVMPGPTTSPPSAAKPSQPGRPPKAALSSQIVVTHSKDESHALGAFLEDATRLLGAAPAMFGKLANIPHLLDQGGKGARSAAGAWALLIAVVLLAVTVEFALRSVLSGVRRRLLVSAPPAFGLQSLASLATILVLDGLGVAAVWLVCHGAIGTLLSETTAQATLGAAILTAIWEWRLLVLVFRLVLQPDAAPARLCAVDDREAARMYRFVSGILLLMALGRLVPVTLRAIETPPDGIASYQALSALVYLGIFCWFAFGVRPAAQQWCAALARAVPAYGWIARFWIPVAPVFLSMLAFTMVYGAISGRHHVGQTMVLTLELGVGVLLFETFLQALAQRLDSQIDARPTAGNALKWPDVAARCIRVAVLFAVGVEIAESWVVQVLMLVDEAQWSKFTHSSRLAALTLYVAFVAWELFKYGTEPYMERKEKSAAEAIAAGDAAPPPASRISTMMPLLRRTAAVLIGLVAIMIALQDFGVNITPLIAGASVFGIAISFGSQTLVKDIVSGIFYLSDDAFRVGEYIDCGKAKGTVEGFTLRSIKLRHQNGQVHTVPFGQLGQITNFSRDWITVKFNLRFARDTDLETLRKASKKIGAEIAALPEYSNEVLAPFKMQGVADILENALLIRFKFTARPSNPAAIQREAVKRMFSSFPAQGIEFAKEGAAVVLQATPALAAQAGANLPATMPPALPAAAS